MNYKLLSFLSAQTNIFKDRSTLSTIRAVMAPSKRKGWFLRIKFGLDLHRVRGDEGEVHTRAIGIKSILLGVILFIITSLAVLT